MSAYSGTTADILHANLGDDFGIAPLPIGPNGQSISLADCGGYMINANAEPAQRRAAIQYALEKEDWIHRGAGGDMLKNLDIPSSLQTVFKSRSQDRRAADNVPADWREAMEQIEAISRQEAPGADWEKTQMGQDLTHLLKSDDPFSAELLHQHFRRQTAGIGIGGSWE